MEDFNREIVIMQSTYKRMADKKEKHQDFNSFINQMMDTIEEIQKRKIKNLKKADNMR